MLLHKMRKLCDFELHSKGKNTYYRRMLLEVLTSTCFHLHHTKINS